MTDKNYMKRRFKCRCYQKDNTVKIYDGSEILFDVSYRDFDDAFYLGRKLQSVIMELNEQYETIQRLKQNIDELLSVDIEEELLKENENLKHRLAISEKANFVTALEKENEQLKTTIQQLRTDNTKQKKKLNTTMKENEQLKTQLSYKSKSVCIICKHHHLVKTDKEYYISKCKKEHEKCSKEDVKYCEDFEKEL